MRCPVCGKKSRVDDSRPNHELSEVVRTRICSGGHRYRTIERPEATSLDHLGVKRTGDSLVRPFDRKKLLNQVRDGVNGVLSEAEVHLVVNGVVDQLKGEVASLVTWEPIIDPDVPAPLMTQAVAYIRDVDLRDIVEHHLKSAHNRVAHVLYAIAVRGRRDREGRSGWTEGAPQVLDFINKQYPNLPHRPRPNPPMAKRYPRKWTVSKPHPGTEPKYVAKSDRLIVHPDVLKHSGQFDPDEVHGRLVKFDQRRLTLAIERSLFGHPAQKSYSRWITWYVLRDLAGQERVTSNQLAVGVLNVLRMVDDLAYLRWAANMKRIPQVAGLRDEAAALIEYPSDQLIFQRPGAEPVNDAAIPASEMN